MKQKSHLHHRHLFLLFRRLHDVAFSREAMVYATVLTVAVLMWFTPTSRSLPYRNFIASITQDLVITKVNPHREANGASPLRTDPLLSEAARLKAEDMLARDYFAHVGPSGEEPWGWFDRVGYRYAAAGENLAIDFSDPTALVNAWLASPSHAANIENAYFQDIGIGVARGEFQERDTTAVVMFLGRPATSPLAVAAPLQPTPPPSPKPTPFDAAQGEPTPLPTPPPSPAATPVPAAASPIAPPITPPSALPTTSQPIPSTKTAEDAHTPLPEPAVSEEISSAPPADAFAPRVITTEIAPTPLRTSILAFLLVKAALFLRILFTAFYGATLAASAVLLAHPAHRPHVRMLPPGLVLFLLAMLWFPEIF